MATAVTSWKEASSCEQVVSGDVAWDSYSNAKVDDNSYTYADLDKYDDTRLLQLSDYFESSDFPAGATLTGLEARVVGKQGSSSYYAGIYRAYYLYLRRSGTDGTSKRDTNLLSTSKTYYTYGGSDDLWGLSGLTISDLLDTSSDKLYLRYGTRNYYTYSSGHTNRVYIDAIQLRAYYTYTTSPTVTTSDCSNVLANSVQGNGNITDTGGANATQRGFCYVKSTTATPTTSDSKVYDSGSYDTGAFSKSITGLDSNSTYRVRAYAINSEGTSYGTTVSVTTKQEYTQSVSGSIGFSGEISKSISKFLSGSWSFTGNISKAISKNLLGTLDFSGILTKSRIYFLTLYGNISFAGNITKKAITKTILGTMDFSGAIQKAITKTLTGTLDFTGAVSKGIYKNLSGVLSFTGGITGKAITKILRGSLSITGKVLFWLEKIFGSVSWTEETKSDESWTELTKSDENWTELSKSGEDWTEESKSEEDWIEHTR